MIKTKYVLEVNTDAKIVLLHLITFDIMIFEQNQMKGWINNKLGEIDLEIQKKLYQKHFLIDSVQDDIKLLQYAQNIFSRKKLTVPTAVIYLTNECNLRCSYCYTGYENEKKNEVISKNDVDSIFESIEKIYEQNEYLNEKPLISLFGGEPLLNCNKTIIEYIMKKIYSGNYYVLEIVTNLINVRLYEEIFKSYQGEISLKVTLNGNEQIHDKIRKFANGKGTYYIILDNIEYVLKNMSNVIIDLSILLDKSITLDGIGQLFDEIEKRGFFTYSNFFVKFGHIQFRSKYVCPGYEHKVIDVADYYPMLFKFKKEVPQIKEDMIVGSSMYMLKRIYNSIVNDEIVTPNFIGCESVYPGRICFFTDGYIYPCYDCVGMKEFIVEYRDKFALNPLFETIKNYSVKNIEKCNNCKFVGVCNGGCIISNLSKNGDIYNVYCENVENAFEKFIEYLLSEGVFDEL